MISRACENPVKAIKHLYLPRDKLMAKVYFPTKENFTCPQEQICLNLFFTTDYRLMQVKMKKINKQCLLDTPRTVRFSEKTWQVIVQTSRPKF